MSNICNNIGCSQEGLPEDGRVCSAAEELAALAQKAADDFEEMKGLAEAASKCLRGGSLTAKYALYRRLAHFSEERAAAGWAGSAESFRKLKTAAVRDAVAAFKKNFKAAAKSAGMSFSVLGTSPEEYKVGAFVVRPDFSEASAEVYYARCLLSSGVSLVPETLVAFLKRQADDMDGRFIELYGDADGQTGEDAEEKFRRCFFSAVEDSCRLMLKCRRRPFGERVPIHDVWALIMASCQDGKFAASGDTSGYREYSKAQMCWDISRLKRLGGLCRGGLRLNLGTATIGLTKNKDQVFWLDDGLGAGQYYYSVWFQSRG